jgi:DNA-binding NarL/FixJ family response regulator
MQMIIADANTEVVTALRLVLAEKEQYQIIGEARDAVNLFSLVTHNCPDVVILDADLPGLISTRKSLSSNLSELVETMRLLCPSISLLAMSSWPDAEKICLQANVNAFVCKSDPPETLLRKLEGLIKPQPFKRGFFQIM